MSVRFFFQFCFGSILLQLTVTAVLSSNGYKYDSCGLLTSNATSRQQTKFNFQLLGYDYDNLPIILMNWGHYDLRWLEAHPKQLDTFQRNIAQWIDDTSNGTFFRRVINDTWTTYSHVSILDFDGLDLRQILSETAIKLVLQTFIQLQKLNSLISYGFIVNANPIAHQVINLAKPLAANLLEHFDVYGTNSRKWKPFLAKKIPIHQLPPAFGGNKDFKPVANCGLI